MVESGLSKYGFVLGREAGVVGVGVGFWQSRLAQKEGSPAEPRLGLGRLRPRTSTLPRFHSGETTRHARKEDESDQLQKPATTMVFAAASRRDGHPTTESRPGGEHNRARGGDNPLCRERGKEMPQPTRPHVTIARCELRRVERRRTALYSLGHCSFVRVAASFCRLVASDIGPERFISCFRPESSW